MYNLLKKILRSLLSRKLLFKIEVFLRYIYSVFFVGTKYECNICGIKLRKFIISTDNEKICPACGSLPRNRRFWLVFNDSINQEGISILDFSPSRNIYRQFKKGGYKYIASDLSGDFISDVQYDITNIDASDKSFDFIICYHILEHVIEDNKAMEELYRVLATRGSCFIQTPFKDGDTYEDFSITSPEDRTKHFGQEDHVRVYSINGLKNRLEKVGFNVQVKSFTESEDNYYGFSTNESILICNK